MAFSVGSHTFSLSAMLTSKAKTGDKPNASGPATGGPAPAGTERLASAGNYAGAGMRSRLLKKFHSAGPKAADSLSSNDNIAAILLGALETATRKFCRDAEPIQHEIGNWSRDPSASLDSTLNPFNKAKTGLPPGTDKNDGLRSGVTGMLDGLGKPECAAHPVLKERARTLKEAVLFRTAEGKDIKLIAFATPGPAGTGGIDDLKLALPDRAKIAARFSHALSDMRDLGEAHGKNACELAPMRFAAGDVIELGRPASSAPSEPAPSGLSRATALRRPGSTFATRRAANDAVRQNGGPRPPAARAPMPERPIDMDRLFQDARAFLTPDEFAKTSRGEIDLMDMVDVIKQRAALNAPGGDFLPAYSPKA